MDLFQIRRVRGGNAGVFEPIWRAVATTSYSSERMREKRAPGKPRKIADLVVTNTRALRCNIAGTTAPLYVTFVGGAPLCP